MFSEFWTEIVINNPVKPEIPYKIISRKIELIEMEQVKKFTYAFICLAPYLIRLVRLIYYDIGKY